MAAMWSPSREEVQSQAITDFAARASQIAGRDLSAYDALHRWSIEEREAFWSLVWDFCEVRGERGSDRVLLDGEAMPGASWFPDARLNYAENLLRRDDPEPAIIFRGEDEIEAELSWHRLNRLVSRTQQLLLSAGVERGDRVAGILPNLPETVAAMLAAVSLGAIWTACSPDFGVQGIVDRFGQTSPKVLFACDGYYYNGRSHDCLEKLGQVLEQLPCVEVCYVCGYVQDEPCIPRALRHAVLFSHALANYNPRPLHFERLPFDHPLFILYSSGTTGAPKCIVHGAGGTLLQHLKEHRLHVGLVRDERLFYFTTCGWMMWNWLVSALASEASLVLYDGSPFYPSGMATFELAEDAGVTVFGTSAKFLDAANKAGVRPVREADLGALRALLSTGSPLLPESFDYVYTHVKPAICLSSIAGGTDIISCFALGNPTLPVHRGELQCLGLGMAVEVWDSDGRALRGEKGELVCTRAFPSMPIGFWNDADGARYRSAYFERFPGVWHHGDYVALSESGGMVFYGRSDATLNPSGVRIGTAEIYRQVETLAEVSESIVIGQHWQGDVRVVLFVVLAEGRSLDEALIERIKTRIRENTTPRHVPARVLQVDDIPRTKSGKIVELAVRDTVHGEPVANLEALANPGALAQFAGRIELRS